KCSKLWTMRSLPLQMNTSSRTKQRPAGKYDASKGAWYRNWEGYLIVLVASFLRFYRIDTRQFEGDQVQIFRLAPRRGTSQPPSSDQWYCLAGVRQSTWITVLLYAPRGSE